MSARNNYKKYKLPKYKGRKVSTSMAGERILAFIDRDIVSSLIITLAGLLYSHDGRRGFPFPWAGDGQVNIAFFAVSFAIIAGIVIFADAVSSAVKRSSEPTAERKYSSYVTDVSHTGYNTYSDGAVPQINVSEIEPSTAARSRNSGTVRTGRSVSYEKKIAEDYEQIKTSVLRPMLNGSAPVSRKTRNRKSSSGVMITVVAVCIIISAFISIIAGFLSDIGYEYPVIDNDNEIIADDYDYDYDGTYAADTFGDQYMYAMTNGDFDWLDEISDGNTDAVSDMTDWENYSYDLWFQGFSQDGSNAVCRYYIYDQDYDNDYIAAFKFAGDDLSGDKPDAQLIGFAVVPFAEWEAIKEGTDSAVSIGDSMIDGASILFWEW